MSSRAATAETLDRRLIALSVAILLLLSLALELTWRVPLRLPGHRAFPEALMLLLGLELTPWRLPRSLWLEVAVGAAVGLGRTVLLTSPHGPPLALKLLGGLGFGALAGGAAHLAIRWSARGER
jgi:hypothetical protein